ncbi:MAG: hypothetical protein WBA74_10705, partial [Cyclobacteriaceae bacterium]
FTLLGSRFNNEGFARKTMSFSRIIIKSNKQKVFPSLPAIERVGDTVRGFYTTVLDDGDVGGDYYEIVTEEGRDNWIQFTEFDEKNRRIIGRFEIHLRLAPKQSLEPGAEPTIDFVDGTFDVLAPYDFVFDQ